MHHELNEARRPHQLAQLYQTVVSGAPLVVAGVAILALTMTPARP